MARAFIPKQPLEARLRPGNAWALIGTGDEIVCYCNDLYAEGVERAIRAKKLTRVAEVMALTHKNEACALCTKRIEALLARVNCGTANATYTQPMRGAHG